MTRNTLAFLIAVDPGGRFFFIVRDGRLSWLGREIALRKPPELLTIQVMAERSTKATR